MKKLTRDETANLSLELIAISGDSAASNLFAIKKAIKGEFDEATKLLNEAQETLTSVHKTHAEILQKEAQGIEPEINTLFVHAQDHFANALVYNELSKYIVDIYKQLDSLKGGK